MGRKAQAIGKRIEAQVDLGLRRYRAEGWADFQVNYPEIAVTRFPACRIIGKAGADRTLTLAGVYGGRTCHLEIKTWQAKSQHTYGFSGSASNQRRRSQYQRLRRSLQFGALAYYLVCWRWDGRQEWRLYPVQCLQVETTGILFSREEGIYVDDSQGWPDWLAAIGGKT